MKITLAIYRRTITMKTIISYHINDLIWSDLAWRFPHVPNSAETFPQNWDSRAILLACGWLKQVFSCRSVWGKMSRSLTFYVRIAIWGINEKIRQVLPHEFNGDLDFTGHDISLERTLRYPCCLTEVGFPEDLHIFPAPNSSFFCVPKKNPAYPCCSCLNPHHSRLNTDFNPWLGEFFPADRGSCVRAMWMLPPWRQRLGGAFPYWWRFFTNSSWLFQLFPCLL